MARCRVRQDNNVGLRGDGLLNQNLDTTGRQFFYTRSIKVQGMRIQREMGGEGLGTFIKKEEGIKVVI